MYSLPLAHRWALRFGRLHCFSLEYTKPYGWKTFGNTSKLLWPRWSNKDWIYRLLKTTKTLKKICFQDIGCQAMKDGDPEREKQTKFATVTAYRVCPRCSTGRRSQGKPHNLPMLNRWDSWSREADLTEFPGQRAEDQRAAHSDNLWDLTLKSFFTCTGENYLRPGK